MLIKTCLWLDKNGSTETVVDCKTPRSCQSPWTLHVSLFYSFIETDRNVLCKSRTSIGHHQHLSKRRRVPLTFISHRVSLPPPHSLTGWLASESLAFCVSPIIQSDWISARNAVAIKGFPSLQLRVAKNRDPLPSHFPLSPWDDDEDSIIKRMTYL